MYATEYKIRAGIEILEALGQTFWQGLLYYEFKYHSTYIHINIWSTFFSFFFLLGQNELLQVKDLTQNLIRLRSKWVLPTNISNERWFGRWKLWCARYNHATRQLFRVGQGMSNQKPTPPPSSLRISLNPSNKIPYICLVHDVMFVCKGGSKALDISQGTISTLKIVYAP